MKEIRTFADADPAAQSFSVSGLQQAAVPAFFFSYRVCGGAIARKGFGLYNWEDDFCKMRGKNGNEYH